MQWKTALKAPGADRVDVIGYKGRKYLAGLTSSNIENRKKAAGASVRWLIGW